MKFEKIRQLGEKGKEARTFLVKTRLGIEYAMKTYRRNKSTGKFMEEIEMQMKCSKAGISPKIVDFSVEEKYIVMEKMDLHLTQYIAENGRLSENKQLQLLHIFKTLDSIGIFHGDANLLNYMIKDGKIYIIDFGLSKYIDEKLLKKIKSTKPNYEIMLLGFVLKLKSSGINPSSYKILKSKLSQKYISQFGL